VIATILFPHPITYPNRGYAQPFVYGTGVVIDATTLHYNNWQWRLFPLIYSDTWGAGETCDITGVNTPNTVITPSRWDLLPGYFGGAGSAFVSGGRLVAVNGGRIYDHYLSGAETSLFTSQPSLRLGGTGAGGSGGRSFGVQLEQEPDR
jgi:hypothetical protein